MRILPDGPTRSARLTSGAGKRLPGQGELQGRRHRQGRRSALPDRSPAVPGGPGSGQWAVVEQLEAEKKLLDIQVDRYTKLAEKGAGSQQDLDQYVAQQAENIGAMKAAQAQVEHGQLNLEFTRITAPIDGQDQPHVADAGNLVNADTHAADHDHVDRSDVRLLQHRGADGAAAPEDDPRGDRLQRIASTDVSRSRWGWPTTWSGKFPLARARSTSSTTRSIRRPARILVRGMFRQSVQASRVAADADAGPVRAGPPADEPAASRCCWSRERAIGTDQGQKFVYVVDKDNKVAYRRVKLGMVFDGLQAIEEGLKAGDRVVVNGLQRIRPGMRGASRRGRHADLGRTWGGEAGRTRGRRK